MNRLGMTVAVLAALGATWSEPAFAGQCASDRDHPKCVNVNLPNGGFVRAKGISQSGGGDSSITIVLVATNVETGVQSRTTGHCECESTRAELRLGPGTYDIEAVHSDTHANAISTDLYYEAF